MPHLADFQPVELSPKFIAPVYLNAWVDFGAPYASAGYFKDVDGVVHLRGLIKSGVIGSPAFNLPAGYRPGFDGFFSMVSNAAFGIVVVLATGDVTPIAPSNNTWVSLEGLTFKAV